MIQNILMMLPIADAQIKDLEENYKVFKLWQEADPESALGRIRKDITGIVSIVSDKCIVSGKLIRALPNLEIIAHCGVGYDNIDMKTAKEQGIVVTYTPDVLTDDVADIATGLVLTVLRRMVESDLYVRTGQWAKKGSMPLGRTLAGRTMGIVGMGRIGQAIARRAEVFGMKVIYFGPNKKSEVSYRYYSVLHKMAEECDVLMLACSYSEATHYLIDSKVLKLLGKNGVLINISRGKVVKEQDLIDALESGVIAGAGLDVFENEPNVPSALCRLDNVVLQSHQGSATVETRTIMSQLVVDNLKLYFEKAEVLTPV